MDIFTAQQMEATDRRSVEQGVSIGSLMESAGAAVARFCLARYATPGLIVVVCGKGNNGGDGLVAAKHLADAGQTVRVLVLAAEGEVKGEPAAALAALKGIVGPEVRYVGLPAGSDAPAEGDVRAAVQAALDGAGLVVDAVLGTGFKPPMRGVAAMLRDILAAATVPVVAVDLPSGWDADSVKQKAEASDAAKGSDAAFRASAVVTFVAPKLAHVFGHLTPGNTFGPVVVASIGTPAGAGPAATDLHWTGSSLQTVQLPREVNGNKGKFGHVLLIGGSFGKSGAPAMASLAALRTGAGLVTAAVPRIILPGVAAITPELMSVPLSVGNDGGLALDLLSAEPLARLLKNISVVAIGPGLGQEGTTPEFVRQFLQKIDVPLVIDADALNAIAGRTALLKQVTSAAALKGKPRTIVLTPHPGEMARLIGGTVKDVEADRIALARRFATEHAVTLVLKGWRTLVAHPDGRVGVNTTGNPGMAKGGSGDILTGIVASMLAQYKETVSEAVEAAVFLHGLAGDFATVAQNEHTVLATDTVAHLWRGFRAPVEDGDGFTWIAGLAARGPQDAVGAGQGRSGNA